jgi:nitrogen-specific signal transduction histidine kinase
LCIRNAQLEELARGREAVRFVASLASTMADEINNSLFVITGNIELLVREISDPVSRQRADAVLRAAEPIRESVKRLNRIAELKLADQRRAEERWSR